MPLSAVAPSLARHTRLRLLTKAATQFLDITDELQHAIAQLGLRTGLVHLHTLHTTTALIVNEHEPLLLDDFARLLGALAPAGGGYDHDDPCRRVVNLTPDERVNGHAHCRALLLPSSLSLHLVDGALVLGRWQRVFFVECDGPRLRELSVMVMGEG